MNNFIPVVSYRVADSLPHLRMVLVISSLSSLWAMRSKFRILCKVKELEHYKMFRMAGQMVSAVNTHRKSYYNK